ncbi:hypothetical protein ACWC5I_30160 [Kitasatospora sp. NPDC001574]
MNMALPLVAFLFIVVALLVRSGEQKVWQVILLTVFGFFLAKTNLADPIEAAVRWMVNGLLHSGGEPSGPSPSATGEGPTAPPWA